MMATEKELLDKAKLKIIVGDIEALKSLESVGLTYNSSDGTSTEWLLFTAATNANMSILLHLIGNGISVSGKAGKGALKRVCSHGYDEIAKTLLDAGVTLNLDDQYDCLNRAWEGAHYDLLILLLNNFSNPGLNRSMIISGISDGNWSALGLILKGVPMEIITPSIVQDLVNNMDEIDVSFECLSEAISPSSLMGSYLAGKSETTTSKKSNLKQSA